LGDSLMTKAAKQQSTTASQIETDWMAKATQSAIDAVRKDVIDHGLNGRSMISSLSDLEWGWICSAAIFAWIKTKAQQAVAEGIGYDVPIRSMVGYSPEPWEYGAVETILPELGEIKGVDWEKPIGEWSKNQIISFACQIHRLADKALMMRSMGEEDSITQKIDQPRWERELSAGQGGPLLSRGELNDDIPF
jgi:hypothetical protein